MKPKRSHLQEAGQIAAELAEIAQSADVLPGSISERRTRCGKPSCACHGDDPARRHGPYWHWTRKLAGKTSGRYLSREEAEEGRRWIENDRRIRELVARLEAIGMERLEAERKGR